MVVKTELCAFSEMKVYPGKGRRFVTKSGQLIVLAGSKVRGLRQSGKKPAKLVWTQAWRRMHKKLNVEQAGRRRARKVVKTTVVRNTVGMDVNLKKELTVVKVAKPKVAGVAGKEAPAAEKVQNEYIKAQKEKAKAAAAERKKSQAGGAKGAVAGAKHAGKGR